jgi:PPOX class probable F420-dependent enzyme
MNRAAIEAMLAEPRILVLTANRGGREPLVAPVWYEYRDGRFLIWTGAGSPKVAVLRRDPAVTLLVQHEAPPYKAVLVRGTVQLQPGRDRDLVRRLATRYLGEREGAAYADNAFAGSTDEEHATLVVTPTAWRAWDYGESGGEGDHVPWTPDASLR